MAAESPSMFTGMTTGSGTNSTEAPNPMDLMAWNTTNSINITSGSFSKDILIGSTNFRFQSDGTVLNSLTFDYWWVFEWNQQDFTWFNKNNTMISGQYLFLYPHVHYLEAVPYTTFDSDYLTGNLTSLYYTLKNQRCSAKIQLMFNVTKYDNVTEAVNGSELHLVIMGDLNTQGVTLNAISFIAGLFTFSLPGFPVIPNLLIWLMIFPSLAYLSFIFAVKIIGAVFGGG